MYHIHIMYLLTLLVVPFPSHLLDDVKVKQRVPLPHMGPHAAQEVLNHQLILALAGGCQPREVL